MFKHSAIIFAAIFALFAPAQAAGPVETSPYAVTGVAMDEHDVSAAAAKDKALFNVPTKALALLGQKLGGETVSLALARMDRAQVMPMLKSISIESETISPGHYQGTFTVRFLPPKLKPMLESLGAKLPEEQGPGLLIIPVWTDDKGKLQVWDDNPWRKAWQNLNASQAAIPIVIPLGDNEDQSTLTADDIAANNVVKLEAIRRRYDVKTMLVAYGQAAGQGVHMHVVGNSPLGKINFDKSYAADSNQVADASAVASQRFLTLITEKFRSDQAKQASMHPTGPQQLFLNVPFAAPSEWNGLRARILATPGVTGLDVKSLDVGGAAAELAYTGTADDLVLSFQAVGLRLARSGANWTVGRL